jgi:hypothetical protein
VLIVTIWITLILAGLVIVLAHTMRAEANCSANGQASAEAAAVEQGAVQYVLAMVDGLQGGVPDPTQARCAGVVVGRGAFWILRPGDEDRMYTFGIQDEGGKLNLNTATVDMLARLPNITADLPESIADWCDSSSESPRPGGAKSEYYLTLPDPYECKNGPMETVEELLWVKGATVELLYGEDANRNGVLELNENDGNASWPPDNADGRLDRGIFPFVTVYSRRQGGAGRPGVRSAIIPINVNTAPKEALACLPGLTDADIATLLSKRAGLSAATTDISWFRDAIPGKTETLTPMVTGQTYQFSADIVSVAGNGRAFRRCRIVVDAQSSPPRVIYRQDWTALGWPLPQEILNHLRAGKPIEQVVAGLGQEIQL